MMPSIRILVVPALAGLLSACTAFFPPDEKDDDVTRCDNVGDCEVPANSRWDVECVHGDAQDESTPKVCAPVFRLVSCDPDDYAGDHALVQKYEQAREVNGVYVGCTMENLGTLGCAPKPTGQACDEGSVNELGVCDDADASYPAADANPDRAGLDVLDQFCRNYFCDSDWMCDGSTTKPVCRPCKTIKGGDPGVGNGGCAEIYTRDASGAAERSTVYVDDVSCGDDGLSGDATTAARLAAEKIGDVPEGT